jgi:hypothetical protein
MPDPDSDPEMDHEFSDLVEWGVPLATVDDYTRHCLEREGAEDSFNLFGYGESPFAEDVEMVKAASAALLSLRNSKGLTSERLSQLCWLEECLLVSVGERLHGVPHDAERLRGRLGELAHLVSEQQTQLAYRINARLKMDLLDIDEEVANATPEVCAAAAAMRDEVLARLAPRMAVRGAFGPALEEAETLRRDRLRRDRLEYLSGIAAE